MDQPRPRHPPLKSPIVERSDLQTVGQRAVSGVLTLVFWTIWAYLWLPLLSLLAWAVGFQQAYKYVVVRGGYEELLNLIGAYTLVIVLLGGSLVGWATYNILRYGRLPMRTGKTVVPHEDIARYFRQGPIAVATWQAAQRLYVKHNEKGEVAGVEILSAGEALPDAEKATTLQ